MSVLNRRRQTYFGIGLAAAIVLAGCGGGTTADGEPAAIDGADEDGVSIGVIYPISGPNAFVAKEMLNGLMLAVDEYNAEAPDGLHVNLLVEDDESSTNTAVSAFRKLVDRDNVSAIVGPFNSDVAAAVAPLAEQAGVPQMATGATANHLVEDDRETFFRANTGNGLQAILTLDYVTSELDWKHVGVIYQETEWGKDLRDISIEQLESAGGTKALDIAYSPGETNFTTIASKAASQSDIDGFIIAALGGEAGPLIRQLYQAGVPMDKVVGYSIDADQVLENAGPDALAGMYLSTPFDPWNPEFLNDRSKAFIDDYDEAYGSFPTLYAAQGHTAGLYLTTAIANGESGERADILRELYDMPEIDSVYGPITFTDARDTEPPLLMQQFNDSGTPETIAVVEQD